MKTKENKLLSYIVYQTKGIQDNYLKIGTQNLDVDCFEIALRKIVKSALRGKPKKKLNYVKPKFDTISSLCR